MIRYEHVPVSMLDDSLIKQWLVRPEAHLFRDCVIARMNQHYLDAINTQSKSRSIDDREKFSKQSQADLDRARELHDFIRIFEEFANPESNLYTIKINT